MSSGERPIGAAKGKQPHTEALCHPPSPAPVAHPPPLWTASLERVTVPPTQGGWVTK